MNRDPDSPASFDLAAAFGRHQPGRDRGGRVMPTHPPLHHGGIEGDRLCWGNTLGPRRRTLAALALESERPAGGRAVLRRRDWFGSGKGLGSAATLVDGTRVGRSLCLCLRPPVPTRMTCTGVWASRGLPVH